MVLYSSRDRPLHCTVVSDEYRGQHIQGVDQNSQGVENVRSMWLTRRVEFLLADVLSLPVQ